MVDGALPGPQVLGFYRLSPACQAEPGMRPPLTCRSSPVTVRAQQGERDGWQTVQSGTKYSIPGTFPWSGPNIERWPRKGKAPEKALIVVVEPDDETRNRCPKCGTRGVPVETDVRRWRTLDVHGKKCFLESALPRIECPQHGKITAAVPWARHDDYFSMPFEGHAAGWPRRCRGRKHQLS